MVKKVLVLGYGSIGKRHTQNLVDLGITPYVLTKFPDNREDVHFIRDIENVQNLTHAIIATPTAQHYSDFKRISEKTQCKNFFIEKPVEISLDYAQKIKKISNRNTYNVFIGYEMKFLRVFSLVRDFLNKNKKRIRFIRIFAGQYLPEWRPDRDYTKSYSAHSSQGGGVDLDLSHEINYMIWLFGTPKKVLFKWKDKISSLKINSPDIFKGIYQYENFIIDLELDYFRKLERGMQILGENQKLIDIDFISKKLMIETNKVDDKNLFNFNECYKEEMKEFLSLTKRKFITSLEEGMKIYNLI